MMEKKGTTRILIGIIVSLIALFMAGLLFLYIYDHATTPETFTDLATLLGDKKNVGVIYRSGAFKSLADAKEAFHLPGRWQKCQNETNRWIIYLTGKDLYAFLTCKYQGGSYRCVMVARRRPTFDFNYWVQKCGVPPGFRTISS